MKPLYTQTKFPAPLPPVLQIARSPSLVGVLSALICLPLLLVFAGEARAQGQTAVPLAQEEHSTDFVFIEQNAAGSVREGKRKDFSVYRHLAPGTAHEDTWSFKLCIHGDAIVNPDPTFTSRYTSSGTYDYELWQWSAEVSMTSNCPAEFKYDSDQKRVDFQIYTIKDNIADSGETITPTISNVTNSNLAPGWASITITIND